MNQVTERTAGLPPTATPPPQFPRVGSQELLKGGRRLIIEHGEARYTLQLTRNGKLILTK
jgi:hemin uptake protein HemP